MVPAPRFKSDGQTDHDIGFKCLRLSIKVRRTMTVTRCTRQLWYHSSIGTNRTKQTKMVVSSELLQLSSSILQCQTERLTAYNSWR